MDSVRRNQDGVKPVMPLINELEGAKTVDALHALQLKYAAFGYGVPMGIGFGADEKNAKMNILNIYQGGLVLGQKEYYLDTDSATTAIREAYKKHIVRMFKLFGFPEADAVKKMENIMSIETALAKVSKSRTELRDVEANYNKMTLEQFESSYPHVNLTKLLNAEGVKTEYFKGDGGRPARLRQGSRRRHRVNDRRRPARIHGMGRDTLCRKLPQRRGGRGQLRLLRPHPVGPQGELSALEARHVARRGTDGRSPRQDVRGALLPGIVEGTHAESSSRISRYHWQSASRLRTG